MGIWSFDIENMLSLKYPFTTEIELEKVILNYVKIKTFCTAVRHFQTFCVSLVTSSPWA